MQRPFTSGSRQAPDPYDQFLEENGYYRKHTARDASCLFRTISEQLYDTQIYHLEVRARCVEYMRKHKSYFQPAMEMSIDEYLDCMSKPKTFGTFLELQAVSFLYERNVLLFEAYNHGSWFSHQIYYPDVFRVFYTPDKHFDSVFTTDYIQKAAFCQSIVYEMLYKHVFKLPDVSFAVEQMLHSSTFENQKFEDKYDDEGYCTRLTLEDGRIFWFDSPLDTSCILDDYQLCHFHNANFTEFAEEFRKKRKDGGDDKRSNKAADSFLSEKHMSCVRQLLCEGITPFPYKVAKALDPDMYRNIEFDTWNEARKQLKLQKLYKDGLNLEICRLNVRSQLQVGEKCHVKLSKSQHVYACHIQEISSDRSSCLVFIEELGEKRMVPLNSLKPFVRDQNKSWSLSVRYPKSNDKTKPRKYHHCSHYRKGEYYHEYNESGTSFKAITECYEGSPSDKSDDVMFKFKQYYAQMQNFHAEGFEFCAMPITVEHDRKPIEKSLRASADSSRAPSRNSEPPRSENTNTEVIVASDPAQQPLENYSESPYYSYTYDSNVMQAGPPGMVQTTPTPYYYMCNPGYSQPSAGNVYFQGAPAQVVTPNQSGLLTSVYQLTGNVQNAPNPLDYNTPSGRRAQTQHPGSGRVNFDAKRSIMPSGSDLPTDMPTLRFFYNLGWDLYRNNRSKFDGAADKDDIAKCTAELQNVKLEENCSSDKSDANNNGNSANNNNGNSYTNQSTSSTHHQRKFHSRYFNRKDRGGFKPSTGHTRYSSNNPPTDQQNKQQQKTTGSGGGSEGQNASNRSHHARSTSQSSTTNAQTPSASRTTLPVTEQGIQTSPMVPFRPESIESQTPPPMYSTPTAYVNVYPNAESVDYMQQSTGMYISVPPPPPPYQFTVPQAMPANAAGQPSPGYSYIAPQPVSAYHTLPPPSNQMPPPPPPQQYYSQGTDCMPYISAECYDNNQYPYVGYSQPIPLYYSPTTSSGGPPPAAAIPSQTYWCVPPPNVTTSQTHSMPMTVPHPQSSCGSNASH